MHVMAHGKEQSHRQCSFAAVKELSLSSEYRNKNYNLGVLNPNPVLYLLVLDGDFVLMDVFLLQVI